MLDFIKSRKQMQWWSLFGIASVLFYFIGIYMQKDAYSGYNVLTQAISDLTAENAPSASIKVGAVYGLAGTLFAAVLCLFWAGKFNRIFRIGIYLFATMSLISHIGYALFPLTQIGYAGTVQDIMHMVVTGIVVFLTIVSLIMLAIGFFKGKMKVFGVLTVVTFAILAGGAMGTGAAPISVFGVFERMSVYSVVFYTLFLSMITFLHTEK